MRCTDVARRAIRAAIADRNIQELHRLAKLYPRAVPDDAPGVVQDDRVLGRRALKGDAGGLGSAPALAVVDAPRVNHDDCRLGRLQSVRHLNDPACIVRKPPGPHAEIGPLIVDQQRCFEPSFLLDRLDVFRMIGQNGVRIRQFFQAILIDSRCRFVGGMKNQRCHRDDREESTFQFHDVAPVETLSWLCLLAPAPGARGQSRRLRLPTAALVISARACRVGRRCRG